MVRGRRPGLPLLAAAMAWVLWAPVAHAQDPTACGPIVTGTWKPELTGEASPIFLAFSTDGWVSLLDSSEGGTRAADFAILAQSSYRLDARSKTPRIDFQTQRGNDLFPPGPSSWGIAAYDDSSFTTTPDPDTGEFKKWVRLQTHRYFITFAAGGPQPAEGGSAFVMWTRLDGRNTQLDALGLYMAAIGGGGSMPVFGPVPAALAKRFATEGDHDEDVIVRVELNEAEFYRTRALFAEWDKRLRSGTLSVADPYQRALEFLNLAAVSVNQCSVRITPVAVSAAGNADRRKQPATFVHQIREANRKRHVDDGMFPFVWEPPPPM